jgi:hypothetical protein
MRVGRSVAFVFVFDQLFVDPAAFRSQQLFDRPSSAQRASGGHHTSHVTHSVAVQACMPVGRTTSAVCRKPVVAGGTQAGQE